MTDFLLVSVASLLLSISFCGRRFLIPFGILEIIILLSVCLNKLGWPKER